MKKSNSIVTVLLITVMAFGMADAQTANPSSSR